MITLSPRAYVCGGLTACVLIIATVAQVAPKRATSTADIPMTSERWAVLRAIASKASLAPELAGDAASDAALEALALDLRRQLVRRGWNGGAMRAAFARDPSGRRTVGLAIATDQGLIVLDARSGAAIRVEGSGERWGFDHSTESGAAASI